MIGLTLRQLHYFDMVARTGHFGRAAEACAVTQPALSMQIQELESQLGVTLFERGRKGAILTEDGRQIAARAARILLDVQDLVDQARQRDKPLSGPLRLGIIPTVAPYLLPPLLPKLRSAYPALELGIRETQTAILLAELSDARLDAAIVALPIANADLESAVLFEDRFILVVPRSYRSERRLAAADEILRGDCLLLLEEGHCFREQALSYCSRQPSSAVNTLGASSFTTIVRMVANGLGITLLPELAIGAEVRSGEVRLLRLPAPEPTRTLGLVWRRSSPRKREFALLGKLIAGAGGRSASSRRPKPLAGRNSK